ncbi:MAG: hypothetical protein V1872_14445 [bacterium]
MKKTKSKQNQNNQSISSSKQIALIDWTTVHYLLPVFINKNIFPQQSGTIQDIKNINSDLIIENNYLIRKYQGYSIGVPIQIIPDKSLKIPEIKLYILAHKLTYIILAEVFFQKKFTNLIIPKQRLVELLGYTPKDKQIYQDIKITLNSLNQVDYLFDEYEFTKDRIIKTDNPQAVGSFISNFKDDHKLFIFDVNENFVGCIQNFFSKEDRKKTKEERESIFQRGYFKYPLSSLLLMKNYSDSQYLLTQFLLKEKGNNKLKEDGFKVIALKVERYIKESNIQDKRISNSYSRFLSTLENIEIIQKTIPTLDELKKLRPSIGLKTILRIWIVNPVEKLEEEIQRILKKRK